MVLTHARVRELLDYEQDTGIFRWRLKRMGRCRQGSIAGHQMDTGYVLITVGGRVTTAHRLAFFWMNGKWPLNDIDHQDRVRSNNCWNNLRETTQSFNSANSKVRSDSKLGVKGVKRSLTNKKHPFEAQITINRRTRGLGYFATIEEAHAAYMAAAKQAFGAFARAS
jgi:hypothetical protein